ncbi:MAG: NfeD family protein [Propionibacteriaceae bacterium]|nr:NfeD family protein [Propionibacteriaceae bacterium]
MWWLAWLIAAVALGVVEAFSLTLAFGIFSAAALLAAIVAGAGVPWAFQLLTFAAASMVGLLVIRPIALRHASQPALTKDGTDALIGRTAHVLEEVSAEHGLIKLSGEDWSARPLDETLIIPAGADVDVMEIQGATAIVYPRDLLP